jgi:hypothetical protein
MKTLSSSLSLELSVGYFKNILRSGRAATADITALSHVTVYTSMVALEFLRGDCIADQRSSFRFCEQNHRLAATVLTLLRRGLPRYETIPVK